MRASDFFRELYGREPGHVVLWRSDTRGSVWVDWSSESAGEQVEQYVRLAKSENFDAYFGVCLQGQRQAGRGTADGVSVVPGLWADVDFAEKPNPDGKARKVYPPRDVAMAVIGELPIKPTWVVHSGGGVHCYWLFDQPFEITDEPARERIARVVQGWQGMLKARLLKRGGYGLDSTHDFARVLRIPNTIHTRLGGREVTIESGGGERVAVETYEGWLEGSMPLAAVQRQNQNQASPVPLAARNVNPGVIGLVTADAEPPGVKLLNLLEASSDFARLWNGKIKRASPSEYDMSLANHAINAGWSDAEAAALLVAFARKNFPDHLSKLLRVSHGRQDYLELTIGKAHRHRDVVAGSEASDEAVDNLAVAVREAVKTGEEMDRSVVLQGVSAALGVEVVGFVQTGRREECYSLLIKQAGRTLEVPVGSSASIHSGPQKMLERIMAECGRYVPALKKLKKEWGSVVQALLAVREFHDIAELNLQDRVAAVVEEHLARRAGGVFAATAELKQMAVGHGDPFVEDGKLAVYGQALKKLAMEIDRGLTPAEVFMGLKSLGFKQQTQGVPETGSTRSYWVGAANGWTVATGPSRLSVVR